MDSETRSTPPVVVTYFENAESGGRRERTAFVDFDFGGEPRLLDLVVVDPIPVGVESGHVLNLRAELRVHHDPSKLARRGWF